MPLDTGVTVAIKAVDMSCQHKVADSLDSYYCGVPTQLYDLDINLPIIPIILIVQKEVRCL